MSNKSKVVVPKGGELEIVVRLNYEDIAQTLRLQHQVFVIDMDKRTAYYARIRLREILGREPECRPATNRITGEHGYWFGFDLEEAAT